MEQPLRALSEWEQLNFLLTNRIPRRLATRLMGRLSRVRSPALTRALIAIWGMFADDLDLAEAKTSRFDSLHECFTRELRDGARPFDPSPAAICSPCDGVVGAFGRVEGGRVYQAKGFPYELKDLIPERAVRERYHNGSYLTLRIKSSMYHRLHAPMDAAQRQVIYVSGDTWNVNPVALKRIEKLYCKNERAVLELWRGDGSSVCMVPVAAILVASIRLHCLDENLDMHYDGPQRISSARQYSKGEELGYFQHGSTVILFTDASYTLSESLRSGDTLQAGARIFTHTPDQSRTPHGAPTSTNG
ncbi:MAG: phosphatidylserine decarboxylase [Halioglobus sp.]|nr:phosphatidylserine decarboxylase [Halioglobus sp.]|tara:strand:- start:1414 stop:2322 length:909 start_codon:yes stop_codon:yes gene_type:complete